ncbi:MAG TPA: ATP-binding protein [Tissierellales bacterium]|nr:ATP-binding protein [Tissierellales bacterium]
MPNKKRIFLMIFVVGFASLLFIDFYLPNFKFSFAGIVVPIFLYIYKDVNSIFIGSISAISLCLFRIIFYILAGGSLGNILIANSPEAIFYIIYGVIFCISKRQTTLTMGSLFFIFFFSDYFSNMVEIYIRIGSKLFTSDLKIVKALILVAFIRAGVAWLIILGLQYYKMFLVKAEHEERYKKLLSISSGLKMEVYWMRKNMDDIEKVMTNAYSLFIKIKDDEEKESWAGDSLEIAKDVHDIKKEYELVVRGIETILADRLDNQEIRFYELMDILKDSMNTEIKYKNKDISLNFQLGENFYTGKHYQLMSIFRNIIMNSIAAIEEKGSIKFKHYKKDNNHIFEVSDNGSGIKEEDLNRIFSPGFSTKVDYATGQINRGLGLSIVKDLVEVYLKGRISVESKENKGTLFCITIPSQELEAI